MSPARPVAAAAACYTPRVANDPTAPAPRPAPEHEATRGEEPRPSRLAPFAVSAAVAAVLLVGGAVALDRFAGELRAEEHDELQAVANLLAGQVAAWHGQALADTATLASLVDLGDALSDGPPDAAAHRALAGRLEVVRASRPDLVALALLDQPRRIHAAVGAPAEAFDEPALGPLLDQAARARGPVMSPWHPGPAGGPVHLDLAAPVVDGSGRPTGFLLLRIDPAPVLLAARLAWPIPNHSATTLLVRRSGDQVQVLGGAGRDLPAPLTTVPLAGDGLLARAVRGEAGDPAPRRGGEPDALVSLAPVAGTDWLLVAQQDMEASLSPLRAQGATLGVALLLALAAVGGVGALWRGLQLARWERRQAQVRAARADLESRIDILSRHAHDMMLLSDERHHLVDVNDRTCELLGWRREELLGRHVSELRDPTTLADFPTEALASMGAEGMLVETRYRRKDGSTFPVEASVRAATFGGRRYHQGIVRDITERRRLELQLQLADRMASVGSLAAGVAHELNNPLAYVLANLDFALTELSHPQPDGAEVRHALAEAREGGVRMRQIVRDLKTFARGHESDRELVDVRRVLQTAVGLAQNEIRLRARLSLELADVPPVRGSEHRLGQAFLNLLVNAAQAISPGAPDRNLVNASTAVAEDGRVVVEVTDTGAGIPAEVLPRIFDPFFTTRPVGSGTGLGLAIVHAIVTDVGGEVRVHSEPGQGTIFTVLLPPAPAATAGPAGHGGAPLPPGAGRVLVVDDEPLVGRAVSRILSPPHQVTVASSAGEALTLLEAGPFDVVLCDLMMPGMTGMDLHARLASADPGLAARFIFLTGGAFTDLARDFLERVPNPRLEKPFEPAALRAAVLAALAAAAPR